MATDYEHRDKLNRIIKPGDWVAYPVSNHLAFGKILRIGPKMIIVDEVTTSGYFSTARKYPSDILRIEDGPEVTMYMLRLQKTK